MLSERRSAQTERGNVVVETFFFLKCFLVSRFLRYLGRTLNLAHVSPIVKKHFTLWYHWWECQYSWNPCHVPGKIPRWIWYYEIEDMAIILPNVKKGRFKRSINCFSLFSKNITLCTSQSLGKVCSYCFCYLARLLWLYLEINVLFLIDYSVKSDRWYKYRYIGKIFNKYQYCIPCRSVQWIVLIIWRAW